MENATPRDVQQREARVRAADIAGQDHGHRVSVVDARTQANGIMDVLGRAPRFRAAR
jgi:hypothetical protein